ncbi:MAG: methanogen output domain 1-containing protein [Candidatus Aenigmarchaeota archaeon]|nr:methanogen output domain 1-containing protein [Candidatus Aenigmarchaeota archaeon]
MLLKYVELLYDPEIGELYFCRAKSAIWERVIASLFQRGFEEILGPATKRVFYTQSKEMIKEFGVCFYISKLEKLGEPEAEEILKKLSTFGYGEFRLISFINREIKIEVRNSFNSSDYPKSERPICYILSGILSGAFEVCTGRKVECEEISCMTMGKSSCEFLIKIGAKKRSMGERKIEKKKTEIERDLKTIKLRQKRSVLYFKSTPSVIFGKDFSPMINRAFEKLIGPAVKGIVYNSNKSTVLRIMEKYKGVKKFLVVHFGRLLKKQIIKWVTEELEGRGYGKFVEVSTEEDKLHVKVKNCHNCIGYKRARKPVCYNFSGIFAGIATAIFFKNFECEEIKCIATGDEYCEFLAEPHI